MYVFNLMSLQAVSQCFQDADLRERIHLSYIANDSFGDATRTSTVLESNSVHWQDDA